jgi:hypothetical protein
MIALSLKSLNKSVARGARVFEPAHGTVMFEIVDVSIVDAIFIMK